MERTKKITNVTKTDDGFEINDKIPGALFPFVGSKEYEEEINVKNFQNEY